MEKLLQGDGLCEGKSAHRKKQDTTARGGSIQCRRAVHLVAQKVNSRFLHVLGLHVRLLELFMLLFQGLVHTLRLHQPQAGRYPTFIWNKYCWVSDCYSVPRVFVLALWGIEPDPGPPMGSSGVGKRKNRNKKNKTKAGQAAKKFQPVSSASKQNAPQKTESHALTEKLTFIFFEMETRIILQKYSGPSFLILSCSFAEAGCSRVRIRSCRYVDVQREIERVGLIYILDDVCSLLPELARCSGQPDQLFYGVGLFRAETASWATSSRNRRDEKTFRMPKRQSDRDIQDATQRPRRENRKRSAPGGTRLNARGGHWSVK